MEPNVLQIVEYRHQRIEIKLWIEDKIVKNGNSLRLPWEEAAAHNLGTTGLHPTGWKDWKGTAYGQCSWQNTMN